MTNGYDLGFLLFIITLMYLMYYFMPKLTSKKQFYGVMLDKKYRDLKELKALDKDFKKLITLNYLFVFALSLILFTKLNNTSIIVLISTLLFLILETSVYVKTHTSVKKIKNELKDSLDTLKTVAIVDTSLFNEKDKIINKFKILYIINSIIIIIIAIYSIANYNPDFESIPIHWNYLGVADRFVENTFTNFLTHIGMLVFIIIIVSILAIATLKSRVKVDTEDLGSTKEVTLKFLNNIGYSFLVLIISFSILIANTLTSIVNGTNLNFYLNLLSTVLIILSSILLIFVFIKSSNLKSTSSYTPDDEEDNWILGLVYYNKNDPSFMIPKKFGIGYTINAAHPVGKIFYIGIVLLLVYLMYDVLKNFIL